MAWLRSDVKRRSNGIICVWTKTGRYVVLNLVKQFLTSVYVSGHTVVTNYRHLQCFWWDRFVGEHLGKAQWLDTTLIGTNHGQCWKWMTHCSLSVISLTEFLNSWKYWLKSWEEPLGAKGREPTNVTHTLLFSLGFILGWHLQKAIWVLSHCPTLASTKYRCSPCMTLSLLGFSIEFL